MNIKRVIGILLLFFCFYSTCLGMEKAFYILRGGYYSPESLNEALSDLTNHAKFINILITQAYRVDAQGNVSGSVDPEIMNLANKHSIKVMVMITNVEFDKEKVRHFLSDTAAQHSALQSILSSCNNNHYYGVQFDFEGVSSKDRDALTQFYQTAADLLHKNGFKVSVAVIPTVPNDGILTTAFLKRKYYDWEGSYDLKALGKITDFITIMTYDQHSSGTTPGPTASSPWVNAAIKYTLQFVPANKISLGIPTYSGYWFLGNPSGNLHKKISVNLDDVSYDRVNALLKKFNIKLTWDNHNKVHYVVWENHWLNEYLFVEDAASFRAKLDLAKKYNLRGISVFDLGNEDPNIWKLFQNNDRSTVTKKPKVSHHHKKNSYAHRKRLAG